MKKTKKAKAPSMLSAFAISIGIGMAVWVALLLIASYLIVGASEPETLILPTVFALAAASAFVSGAVGGKLSGAGVMAPGLICGFSLLAIVFVLSLISSPEGGTTSLPLKFLLVAEFPLFAMVGARVAMPSRTPKTKRPARVRR